MSRYNQFQMCKNIRDGERGMTHLMYVVQEVLKKSPLNSETQVKHMKDQFKKYLDQALKSIPEVSAITKKHFIELLDQWNNNQLLEAYCMFSSISEFLDQLKIKIDPKAVSIPLNNYPPPNYLVNYSKNCKVYDINNFEGVKNKEVKTT
jgi:CID domain